MSTLTNNENNLRPSSELSLSKYRSKSYCQPISEKSFVSIKKDIPVKVALRIKPLLNNEEDDSEECLEYLNEDEELIVIGENKAYTFDNVFSKNSSQEEVYEKVVKPLLITVFQGYNATVLAYGQTSSGKTYTMGLNYPYLCGVIDTLLDKTDAYCDLENVGLIPRVLSDLFKRIETEHAKSKDTKYTVRVSFIEIYNEQIKDLFKERSSSAKYIKDSLNICEKNNNICVNNLTEIKVKNTLNVLKLLKHGCSMRVARWTAMNEESSRSHAIFTIILEQSKMGEYEMIRSKFHLVDLAGSEQQKKTKTCGSSLKESIKINLGLFALGNVISRLGKTFIGHVPYRESKLTRLLQDSLGGNSHTVMIACVNPEGSNIRETRNTIRFANRVKKVKNKPVVNIDPKEELIIQLRKKVKDLEEQLEHHEQIRERNNVTAQKLDYGCQTIFVSEEESDNETKESVEDEEDDDDDDNDDDENSTKQDSSEYDSEDDENDYQETDEESQEDSEYTEEDETDADETDGETDGETDETEETDSDENDSFIP